MGILNHILASLVHLLLVALDVFFLMLAVTLIYERWQPARPGAIYHTIEPLMRSLLDYCQKKVRDVTGKAYSNKTVTILMILALSILRWILITLVS